VRAAVFCCRAHFSQKRDGKNGEFAEIRAKAAKCGKNVKIAMDSDTAAEYNEQKRIPSSAYRRELTFAETGRGARSRRIIKNLRQQEQGEWT